MPGLEFEFSKKQTQWHSHTQREGTTILAINAPVTCAWGMLMWPDSDRRGRKSRQSCKHYLLCNGQTRPDDSEPRSQTLPVCAAPRSIAVPSSCCDRCSLTEKWNTAEHDPLLLSTSSEYSVSLSHRKWTANMEKWKLLMLFQTTLWVSLLNVITVEFLCLYEMLELWGICLCVNGEGRSQALNLEKLFSDVSRQLPNEIKESIYLF